MLKKPKKEIKFGREERSRSGARRSLRKKNRKEIQHANVERFVPPDPPPEEPNKNKYKLSVNRLDTTKPPHEKISKIGIDNAELIGKEFWGWYILSLQDIEDANQDIEGGEFKINESPIPNNRYHADIIIELPPDFSSDKKDRRRELKKYANALAKRAIFHQHDPHGLLEYE